MNETNFLSRENVDNKTDKKEILQEKITRRDFMKIVFSFFLTLLIQYPLDKAENTDKKLKKEKNTENLREDFEKMEKSVVDIMQIAVLRSNNFEGIDKICNLIEKNYEGYINNAIETNEYNIDPDILKAMIFLESSGVPEKNSTDPSGAVGLMQILPETAKDYGINSDDRTDPEISINTAVKILKNDDDLFGSQDLAIANYHIGFGNTADLIIVYAKEKGIKDLKSLKKIITDNKVSYRDMFFNKSKELLRYEYKENGKTVVDYTNTNKILSQLEKDNAPLYLWKVKAIAQIIKNHKNNLNELKSKAKKYISMKREDVLKEAINKLKKDGFNDEQIEKLRLEKEF